MCWSILIVILSSLSYQVHVWWHPGHGLVSAKLLLPLWQCCQHFTNIRRRYKNTQTFWRKYYIFQYIIFFFMFFHISRQCRMTSELFLQNKLLRIFYNSDCDHIRPDTTCVYWVIYLVMSKNTKKRLKSVLEDFIKEHRINCYSNESHL